jgi:hypothetical protein
VSGFLHLGFGFSPNVQLSVAMRSSPPELLS